MKSSVGINWQYGLMVNMSELAFAAFMEPELQRQVLRARMAEPGLVLNPAGCGNAGLAWRLEQVMAGGDLLIRVDKGVPWAGNPVIAGVMSDGQAFAIEVDLALANYVQLSDITVPDDAQWRTLTVTRAVTKYEPGVATFTASSTTVTGTGTQFTRLSGRTMDGSTVLTPGDKIYVTSGGNAGEVYEVDNIVSDTELEITAVAIADQDAAIVVAGSWYLNGAPTDPQAHNNPSYTIELQSGVVMPSPSEYLIIADVMLATGSSPKIQIIDRRTANMFRLKPDARAMMRCATLAVSMSVASCNSTTITEPTYYQEMVAETRRAFNDPGGAYEVFWTSMAPCSNGIDVLAISTALGDYVLARKYTANTTVWSGSVQPDSSGDVKAAHLQLLPAESGNTHTLVFQIYGAATIYQRRSPDDGATWSGLVAIMNDADIVDAPTPVILTRAGRMWIFYSYNDGSTYYGIRAVYSDTYGNTWNTNGGLGHEVITRAYDGAAFIAAQDVTETDDGRMALLCADQQDVGMVPDPPVMTVLLTESTLSALWDDGGEVAGAPVGGPDTVRLYDKIGVPVYALNQTFQSSAIQALPGQSFGIISYIYDPSGGAAEDLKTWASVVSMGNARVDPFLSDRRTLEVLDHTELNWIADAFHALAPAPNAVSARIMPGGEMMVLARRSWTHAVYDSIKVRVCDSPRVLTFQPACFGDLNP